MSLDFVTEYALSFGGDAVHLQKRDRPATAEAGTRQPAWRHLGSVDFDEPDFHDMLVNLRTMATGQPAEAPLAVQLVIPDDQILYTTLTVAPAGDREGAVARALDGLTPYAIEDLSFDWRGEGDSVRVAAVARQTLQEAREFAAQYGFQGVAFCADPESELFPGEPVFTLAEPPRPRLVDPGSASVTASGLLIEDEPAVEDEADTDPGEAVNAPDLTAPAALPEAPAVETPTPVVSQPVAPVVETPVPGGPAPVPPPVVRHVPARPAVSAPAPVPGPEDENLGSPHLNPRARAVHKRAADARHAKPAGVTAPTAPPRPVAPHRRNLRGLAVMLVILIIGLALLWSLSSPEAQPAQGSGPDAPAASSGSGEAAPLPRSAPDATNPAPPLPLAPDAESPAVQPADPAPEPAKAEVEAASAVSEPVAAPQMRATIRSAAELRDVLPAASATAAAIVLSSRPAAVDTVAPAPVEKAAPTPAPSPVPTPAASPAAPPVAVAEGKPATRPEAAAAPVAAPQLTSSARPQLSPRRSTPQTTEPRTDTTPRVPESPLPFAASQTSGQLKSSLRPPKRKETDRHSHTSSISPDGDESARAGAGAARPLASADTRPPQRPEGSASDALADEALSFEDQRQLQALILDLDRHGLVTAKAVPRAYGARFAEARPKRKPVSDAVSAAAVEKALKSAAEDKPARSSTSAMKGSSRPAARPGNRALTAAVSDEAVNKAIAAAVEASPAMTNGAKLASSPLPPRRSGSPAADAPEQTSALAAPAAGAAIEAAAPGPSEAEMAARRALDEQLQAQAEARIRARAQADAAAEAQARAQAEARARAQVEAEERAAQARKQVYKPQEIDDEPEVAANVGRGGTTAAKVAANATERRGMDPGRTTIIGIIGAGNASRALIRLRNGKIVTVRLGDKINGGTINSIGNGRLTYVKAGRTGELRMLDGK